MAVAAIAGTRAVIVGLATKVRRRKAVRAAMMVIQVSMQILSNGKFEKETCIIDF